MSWFRSRFDAKTVRFGAGCAAMSFLVASLAAMLDSVAGVSLMGGLVAGAVVSLLTFGAFVREAWMEARHGRNAAALPSAMWGRRPRRPRRLRPAVGTWSPGRTRLGLATPSRSKATC
jgi:hypothetical protein